MDEAREGTLGGAICSTRFDHGPTMGPKALWALVADSLCTAQVPFKLGRRFIRRQPTSS